MRLCWPFSISWSTPLHERFVGLAGQAEDQVRIGLDLVAREAALQLHVGAERDVVALDRLQGRHVDALHGERHALVQPGVRQDLLRLIGPLGRVLGVLHRKGDRIAGILLDAGDILGDVDVALLDAEVGVAAEDVFDLLLGEPVDLAIQPLLAELGDLGRRRRSPVAEGAAERAAAIGLPQADPALLRIGRHDRIERPFEEGRGNLVEIAHAVDVGIAHEAAVRLDEADARQRLPGAAIRERFQQLQERALALVVDREVDLGVGAQEGLRLVRHVRAAEDDDDAGLCRLQAAGDLQRDAAVPHIGAETDQVGILQRLDGIGDAHPLVERRQEGVATGVGRHLLHIGLQQSDRIGQIVLAGEGVVDLHQAHHDGRARLHGRGCPGDGRHRVGSIGRRHRRRGKLPDRVMQCNIWSQSLEIEGLIVVFHT